MPIPSSHMKERLSIAYVEAVTARSGARFVESNSTEYGVDGQVRQVRLLSNGNSSDTGWTFDCQVKSTVNLTEEPDSVVFDMKVEAYNKLVDWEGSSSCILILFRLPKDEEEWLNLDEESFVLKNCCYWDHLKGPPTSNVGSVRIRIPRAQLFTPDSVSSLLSQITKNKGRIP